MKTKITELFAMILAAFISLNAQYIGAGPGLHTIAAKSDGTVYTWGYNLSGQLGNGNTGTNSNVPVAVYMSGVLSGKTITQVATGNSHSIALASDGKVYTWGWNFLGQLGNGNNTNSNVPVAVYTGGVLNGKTITQVAAGTNYSIALDSDGKVYTWGENTYGQLGNGNNTNSNVPVAVYTSGVLNGKTITKVAAAGSHSIVLASNGTVYTWGYNGSGELGNGNNINSNVPVAVVMSGILNGKIITQVAAAGSHSIALASNGTVYTWGRNANGELGNGNTGTNSNVPVAVYMSGILNGKIITQVAAASSHSIALASIGTVYTWGDNLYGYLGNGNNTDSNVPVAVNTSGVLSGKTITQVANGLYHSIALANDGTVYTWGENSNGQLGNGNTTNSNVPVAVDLSSMGLIPVELTSFTAASTGSTGSATAIVLNWQTATELNNYGFEIQRSVVSGQRSVISGQLSEWETIGFVKGHNNSISPKQYSFIDSDNSVAERSRSYRLKQIDNDGSFEYSDVVEIEIENLPTEFALMQNYPNPFNPTTTIKFGLPKTSNVKLELFNIIGEKIATLIDKEMEAGHHNYQLSIDNYQLTSGVYIYKLQSGSFIQTKKLLLMK